MSHLNKLKRIRAVIFFITSLTCLPSAYATPSDTSPQVSSSFQNIDLQTRRSTKQQYTGILQAKQLFSGMGLSWEATYPAQSVIEIMIRTSQDKKTWQDWRSVHAHDLSQNSHQTGFEYAGLFASPMLNIVNAQHRYLEYKIVLHPNEQGAYPQLSHIRADFIHSEKTSTDMLERIKTLSQQSHRRSNQPNIISRHQWGANESVATWSPTYTNVTHVVIHHTVNRNDETDWPQVVRNTLEYHAVSRGWGDIGYNYLIDPNGVIYEGRKGGDNVIGAHAGGSASAIDNRFTVGIAFLGDFREVVPTAAALSAAEKLIAWKTQKENINPLTSSHWNAQVYLPHVLGHRDVKSTLCPGEKLYALLPQLRQNSAHVSGLDIYDFWYKSPSYADANSSSDKPNFDAQFKVKNSGTSDINIERLALSVHETSGAYLFDMQWANSSTAKFIDNLRLAANETYHFDFSTGYIHTAGDYLLVAKAYREGQWQHLAEQVFTVQPSLAPNGDEIHDLSNTAHMTSWAYYLDQNTNQWLISNAAGATYILSGAEGYQGELVWGEMAGGRSVATVDFAQKTVTLSTLIDDYTHSSSYKGIPLSNNPDVIVNSSRAYDAANAVAGRTLDLIWYFFRVEATGQWYIIYIPYGDATIFRLGLKNDLSDYDWQAPEDSAGNALNSRDWQKSFFQNNGAWWVNISP